MGNLSRFQLETTTNIKAGEADPPADDPTVSRALVWSPPRECEEYPGFTSSQWNMTKVIG